ncbi:MAG: endonuclease/exonuclease/phosphatase family protein, partial [Candidatus Nanopelagicales bacterium]
AMGTPYRAVAVDTTFSNETFPLPAVTATGLRLVAFTDYNVILVRESSARHLRISNVSTHTYQATLPVTVAGMQIPVTRGWAQVDVSFHGRAFRFVDTHLEAWGVPDTLKDQVRNPQAMELAAVLAASPIPVVLVGDMNARPDMCTDIPRTDPAEHALDQNVVAYTILRTSGLTEAWYAVHRHDPCAPRSWTSGSRILDDPTNRLTHRIDDVFTSHGARTVAVTVVGNRPWAMTGGLWPSDHASTWALVRIG